ncbi:DUF7832 domain-containing protein [Mycobacterium branderi]|uniref:DUF7832 domain-containing protein n=1 Tax=Mycobacterium branderi TaxID=43348 RepID=A0A7I7WDE2_9MYCO|nr:hypothetical protein [Mycobacterium branderi]MCV7236251.1 hypothetical protein [Mycobacterium branderi]ORA35430.1 hypothetical protein BST20_17700 [Mycobacterium branderi]BBZ15130.1 hypothetical protein MBRA_53250 [Mycobacterium branderi]
MTYDDASWHHDSVIENGLEAHHAATHIGMFFAWLAHHDMVDPSFRDVSPLIDRTVTPGRFLIDHCCGEIDEFMLTKRGAAFTAAAYGPYAKAYDRIPEVARHDVSYAAPDSWELYDAVAPQIDEAYRLFNG